MPSVVCSCGKTIETKPEWAGAFIRCRGCASKIYVPRPEEASPAAADPLQLAAPETSEAPPPLDAETRPCPYCAEPIRKQAIKCRWCGQSLVLGRAGAVAGRPSRPVRTDTGGTGILVVAILGWVFGCLGLILLPIAWAMGASHESSCIAQRIEPSGAAKAGKILGMVGTILYGIGVLFFILVAAAGGMK